MDYKCSVSVIIPTYKHRDYVSLTLDSVFKQTFTDYEVIVINDGSPDDTGEVLRPFIEQNRIRYIEQENGGQARARNRGLAEAKGEFIAFLDDDDLWPVDKLEWQVAALREQPAVGVIGGACEFINDDGEHIEDFIPADRSISVETLFSGSPFASPGQALIRTSCLRKIGGFNESIWGADDLDLWFRLARQTGFLTVPKIALLYRIHPANASKNVGRMFVNCLGVVKSNLQVVSPADRLRLSRNAYRWLYSYAGRHLVADLKTNLRTVKIRKAAQNILLLKAFALPSFRDIKLCRRVCSDICPNRLRSVSGNRKGK
jgi:glycosyltransferase involved in cell wall biosynthesis